MRRIGSFINNQKGAIKYLIHCTCILQKPKTSAKINSKTENDMFFIALFQKQMSEWSDTTKASSH